MTEVEQRIAIALFCGWWSPDSKYWFRKDSSKSETLPDYPHDLNAMREAWSHLDEEAKIRFIHELYTVCGFDICVFGHDDTRQASEVSNATAAQRAEALLRAIGNWVDSPSKSACQPGISGTTVLL